VEQFHEGLYDHLDQYVQMLAWWHAIPDPPKGVPASIRRQSRMELRLEAGGEVGLPEIPDELVQFIHLLFEAGPSTLVGENMMPVSWADLDHYQSCIGVRLPPWQLRLLRRLSVAYVKQLREAREPDAPPPWEENLAVKRKEQVARHIRNVLRGK